MKTIQYFLAVFAIVFGLALHARQNFLCSANSIAALPAKDTIFDPPEISDHYIEFDTTQWTFRAYNQQTMIATVSFSGNQPPFVAGETVTTLVNDTIGYFIRKIEQIDLADDTTLLLTTAVADMEDIFVNKSFTLTTASKRVTDPNLQKMPSDVISKAMTDENGMIHPVEIILYKRQTDGSILAEKINLLDPEHPVNKDRADINIIDIYEDLNNTELFSYGAIEMRIDSGLLSFTADAVFEFDFKPATESQKLSKGKMDHLQFYLQGEAKAEALFKLEVSGEYIKEGTVEIYEDIVSKRVKFMVGVVPVWINFGADLLSDYHFEATATAEATWGFDLSQTAKIGGAYSRNSKAFEVIAEEELTYNFRPLEVAGEVHVNAYANIYPRLNMMIWDLAGPYCDLIPYLEADYKATAMANTSGETDLKWYSKIDLGLDYRAGLKPAFLESLLGEVGPYSKNLLQKNIWHAPAQVDLISQLDNSYILPVTIPLKFKVTDYPKNWKSPFAPVFLEAENGELSKEWAMADAGGVAEVEWTLDNSNVNQGQESQKLHARLISPDDDEIHHIVVQVNVSTKPTAFYMEGLNEPDTIYFNNLIFDGIQKGVFAKGSNKGNVSIMETTFKECESALSGSFDEVKMIESVSFYDCQSAVHIEEGKRLVVDGASFQLISNNAIYFGQLVSGLSLRNSQFQNCKMGVSGANSGTNYFTNIEMTECEDGLRITDANFAIFEGQNSFHRATLPDGSYPSTAISLENTYFDLTAIDIQNFHNGIKVSNTSGKNKIRQLKILNAKRAVELYNISNASMEACNISLNHPITDNGSGDDYVGLFLKNSHNNTIVRNTFSNLCTAIKEQESQNDFVMNTIQECQCNATGINSFGLGSRIMQNTFSNNAGAAFINNQEPPSSISMNNFVQNSFGIVNYANDALIEAVSNYFEGQLEANSYGNVQTIDDLTSPVGLVGSFLADTIRIPSATNDSLPFHVQHHLSLNDSVEVSFTDEFGWLTGQAIHRASLKDSTGMVFYQHFSAVNPGQSGPALNAINQVKAQITAIEAKDALIDSVVLVLYDQIPGFITISSDSLSIRAGDSLQLMATAFDQYSQSMELDFLWSSSAGNMTENGKLLTEESTEGEIVVTVSDLDAQIFASATIFVSPVAPRLEYVMIQPHDISTTASAAVQFNGLGYNQFYFPMFFQKNWQTTGGVINNQGVYLAPEEPGDYLVVLTDLTTGLSDTATVRVNCFEYLNQMVSLCDGDSLLINDAWVIQPGFYRDTTWNESSCHEVNLIELHFNPLPEVTLELTAVCENQAAFPISGGFPEGGVYSGFGVTDGLFFDASLTGAGLFEIQYTYTNEYGCSNGVSDWILVQEAVDVMVNILADQTEVCAGTPVSLTAAVVNGGTDPQYQWKLNGENVGENNPAFSFAPADGDQVQLELTSSESCTQSNPVVSDVFTFTVYPLLEVQATIVADQTEVCAGTPVSLTAAVVNGGTDPQYQWKLNGENVGENNPAFGFTPADGDQVQLELTSSEACTQSNPVLSSVITFTVYPLLEVQATISADQTEVCAGTPVSLTAAVVNGGTDPQYQWKLNGENVGENNPAFSFTPADGDQVQLELTSSEACTQSNPVVSDVITFTVYPLLEVQATIVADQTAVCAGTLVSLTAAVVNGGTDPQYQWKLNGDNVGENNPAFSFTPSNGDQVQLELTSSEACTQNNPVLSSVITFTVYPLLEVQATIVADQTEVCAGTPVSLTAAVVNGGTDPQYQWKLNGDNVGENNPAFSFTPADGDQVQLELTSSEACTQSNPVVSDVITFTVYPLLEVQATIVADQTEVCAGTPVSLTAEVVNGGTDPQYQWKLNGENVGENNPAFSFTPADGDQVQLELTSSEACTQNNPVVSSVITFTVYPLPEVTWAGFEPDTLCIYWEAVLLSGGLPIGGDYSGNGVDNGYFNPAIAGQGLHQLAYAYTNEFGCSAQAVVEVFVDYCTDASEMSEALPINLFPNPAADMLYIKTDQCLTTVNIKDVAGRMHFSRQVSDQRRIYSFDVSMLPKGVYVLQLKTATGVMVRKFIKK